MSILTFFYPLFCFSSWQAAEPRSHVKSSLVSWRVESPSTHKHSPTDLSSHLQSSLPPGGNLTYICSFSRSSDLVSTCIRIYIYIYIAACQLIPWSPPWPTPFPHPGLRHPDLQDYPGDGSRRLIPSTRTPCKNEYPSLPIQFSPFSSHSILSLFFPFNFPPSLPNQLYTFSSHSIYLPPLPNQSSPSLHRSKLIASQLLRKHRHRQNTIRISHRARLSRRRTP